MKSDSLTIGFKNQAPTSQDKSHHEYHFIIYPLNLAKPFMLAESIGGGHGERGGSVTLSLTELLNYNNWREHLEKSNCSWAINIIEDSQTDVEAKLDALIAEVNRRNKIR